AHDAVLTRQETDSEPQLAFEKPTQREENNNENKSGKTSYYTGRPIYLKRLELVLDTEEDYTSEASSQGASETQKQERVYFATGDNQVLRLDQLPDLFDQSEAIQTHAIEIIKDTWLLSSERAVHLGYLSDRCIDLSEFRSRCYAAVEAAFEAAEHAWYEGDESPCLQDPRSGDAVTSSKESSVVKTTTDIEEDESNQQSYCCYVAMIMAARVLDASTAKEMVDGVQSGVNLDDLILNIESIKPPTESNPWETNLPDKPGYHHVYALLGTLMATAYVNQCFVIETVYLDRAISNLDVSILKKPEYPFKEFRNYLEGIHKKVQHLKIEFQRLEVDNDPRIDSVICSFCFGLRQIGGVHETEYPFNKMEFREVCENATLRCKSCLLFRDSAASLYPLLDMCWEDIREINYINRSVGRRWLGESEDLLAYVLWGAEGALGIDLIASYLGSEHSFTARYELYCYPGSPSPWNIIGTGKHVQSQVDSEITWEMVRGWIQDCVDNHEDCKSESEDRPFPTRLIFVGDNESEPHLYIPAPDQRGRYIALSHCWGDSMPIKTIKSTFDEFCRGIEVSRIPKAFHEAIITLCIIQDDEDDWALESPRMGDVYQNAYLTIAAAASQNSNEGLFHPRPFSIRKEITTVIKGEEEAEKVDIFARPWRSDWPWSDSIGDGPSWRAQNPLEKRAWTLQEHVLSRRILRFTAHELVWHCQEVHLCECRSHSVGQTLKLMNLRALVANNPEQGARVSNPMVVWHEIVGPFTGRNITRETDRLPALSGVAAALAPIMKKEYVAGTWMELLGKTICWHVEKGATSRHKEYYAPTWSWASVVGLVQKLNVVQMNELPQTDVVNVQWTAATINPYGRVSDARLTIKGILLDVPISRLDPEANKEASFHIQFGDLTWLDTDMKLSMACLAFPDVFSESENAPELVLGESISFLLVVCKVFGKGFDSLMGVLLKQVEEDRSSNGGIVYRKMGTGEVKLRNTDRDEGEFQDKADEGLAWYLASHLEAQGCVWTVVII
ncbi:hypothetical protein ACHAP4_010969, partial [Fusarium culmorum]